MRQLTETLQELHLDESHTQDGLDILRDVVEDIWNFRNHIDNSLANASDLILDGLKSRFNSLPPEARHALVGVMTASFLATMALLSGE